MKPMAIKMAGLLAVVFLLSSCVSTKKYDEALGTIQNAESRYLALADDYEALQSEKQRLEASTSEALKKKERELAEKERMLADREEKVKELRALQQAQKDAVEALKQEVCSALKCFTPDELKVNVREGKLYVSMSDKLLFPSGSDQMNERGQMAVEMLSAVLSNSDLEIVVEGHTDDVPIHNGTNKDNWDLSVHRATTVTREMIDNGISPKRIIAGGRGEYKPVDSNESAEGRKQNRRTEIVLAPKLDKLWELTEEDVQASNQ